MSANPTWERVLAAVEADAVSAEAMLRPEPEHPEPAELAQDQWLVPAAVLPPLAEMPDVPEELRERIEALRDRIDALSAELEEALRDLPGGLAPRSARVMTSVARRAEPSRFVDQRV